MKKKKIIALLMTMLVISTISFTGCSGMKMSKDKQEILLTEVSNMVKDKKEVSECALKIDDKIKKVDKDTATKLVDSLISLMYSNLEDLNMKAQSFQGDFKKLVDKKLDLNSPDVINKCDNVAVKGIIQDIQLKKLLIKNDSGKFFIQPNLKSIHCSYGNYINDDLSEVLKFRIEEGEHSVFKPSAENFDLDLLAKRLVKVQQHEEQYKDSIYCRQWMDYEFLYYNMLFGRNHPFFMDSKNEIFSDSVFKIYEKLQKDYPNTQMTKDIKAYYDVLKKNNRKINKDTKLVIEDIFNKLELKFQKKFNREQQNLKKEIKNQVKNQTESKTATKK